MELSEYLPLFLAEATEHLQALNLAVVLVEATPGDRETVDQVFRIAHSFKGSSATMGFEGLAALTHHMEDVFELLRQRSGGIGRAAIDVLLECLDALSAAVESIERTGAEAIEPTVLIARLRALVRPRQPAPARAVQDAMTPTVLVALAQGRRVVHVRVILAADVAMPAVRAFMVLAALSEHGETLGSAPAEDDLDDFRGTTVEAWLATDHQDDRVIATVLEILDVTDVELLQATAPPPEPEVAAAPALPPAPVGWGGGRPASTIRVDVDRLDQLMRTMGELVMHRTRLEAVAATAAVPGLEQAVDGLVRSSDALQAMLMQMRMLPVEAVFARFPRLVRDLSSKLDKQVELRLLGSETALDRTVLDVLGDPLAHLVRNALDHGLEGPVERRAAGKPTIGVLEISARHAGVDVLIQVRDDGRGIDPARVAAIAARRGLIGAGAIASIDRARAVELLFTPGFSTAESTSDISGRGVGLDAVRTTVRDLGGEVVITSEPGAGTRAEIRLPLTLAILPTLMVRVGAGAARYAFPVDRVARVLCLADGDVEEVAGRPTLLLDGERLPLLDGAEVFGHRAEAAPSHAVVVRAGDGHIAIGVSDVVGRRELVVRPLPTTNGDHAAVSGGAALAGGELVLIVDCDVLTAGRIVGHHR